MDLEQCTSGTVPGTLNVLTYLKKEGWREGGREGVRGESLNHPMMFKLLLSPCQR